MKKIATVGIVGGGQLALMTCQAARGLELKTIVIDPNPSAPAFREADLKLILDYREPEGLKALARECDVITFDLENVPCRPLFDLESEGAVIRPSPGAISLVQDKLQQREKLVSLGLPAPRYQDIGDASPEALRIALASADWNIGPPYVQKLRRGGYDGRGVHVIRNPQDIENTLRGPSLLEEMIPIEKELAVMAARSASGEIVVYPTAEMVFREGNMLDLLTVPARISSSLEMEIRDLSAAILEGFEIVGICGIEFFLDSGGRLLVNELSPRPHNSGHYTIEACTINQFEQHLRAVAGLALKKPELRSPAAMFNLIGQSRQPDMSRFREMGEVHLHWYGKGEARPRRKMGHVTVLGNDPTILEQNVKLARERLGLL